MAAEEERLVPFEFHGAGGEYFKIWIVNILLTILTLGIYSAWAKVRNNRYFYSNVLLDGEPFQYLADPITILKGRLIAIAAFVIYILASNFAPFVGLGFLVLLLVATPWLVVRSIMFNHRMSAYRNVQFRFHGKAGEAAMVFYVWPLIGALTLGLLYPLAILRLNQFIVNNTCYGTSPFTFKATFIDYAIPFLIMLGVIVAGVVGSTILMALLAPSAGEEQAALIGSLILLPVYLFAFIYINVQFFNLRYMATTLEQHGFDADAEMPGYGWVTFTNLIGIVLTLGLFLPVAKVRTARYFSEHLQLVAVGSLDNFVAAEQENVNALAEELGEVFDFDIGVV